MKMKTISLLDQLAPPLYMLIVLFYSASDVTCTISDILKKSLSETLASFYPSSGRIKGNDSIQCNDEVFLPGGDIELSEILKNPEIEVLQQFLPFEPYKLRSDKEAVMAGIQVNVFDCGGVGIGVCISHKIADGATMASFLTAWAATASGVDETITPHLDSALLFPPKSQSCKWQSDTS